MKEVDKKDTPEISGGLVPQPQVVGDCIPPFPGFPDFPYPPNPSGPGDPFLQDPVHPIE